MINYAIEHGINRYNFYGISGDFSEDAEDAGVVKFKKGYDADVIEYVGLLLNLLINQCITFIEHLKTKEIDFKKGII